MPFDCDKKFHREIVEIIQMRCKNFVFQNRYYNDARKIVLLFTKILQSSSIWNRSFFSYDSYYSYFQMGAEKFKSINLESICSFKILIITILLMK